MGEVWVDMAGTNWSINIAALSDVTLCGWGSHATTIVQTGVGTGADWMGIRVYNSSRVKLRGFGIRQGTIQKPSNGQHDHLIYIATSGVGGVCDSIEVEDIRFGKSIGDGLAFVGDESPITNVRVSRCWFKSDGFVLRSWTPNTAYTVGDVVRNGLNAYYCTVAGTSGNGAGPVATVEMGTEVDGSCTWRYSENYYRFAARACMSFQRGYHNLLIEHCHLYGAQNSPVDMESTASDTSPTMRLARFVNCWIDNSIGKTSIAMSFSGSHSPASDKSEYPELRGCVLYQGRLQIAETSNAKISDCTILMTEQPDDDATLPLVEVRFGNAGLTIENCSIERVGTSAAGDCIDIAGGGPVTIRGGRIIQATAGRAITWDTTSDVTIDGVVIDDTNATAGRAMIDGTATTGNSDRPTVRNVVVRATGATALTAVKLQARSTHSMAKVEVVNVQHTGCTWGAYFSFTATSAMDRTPVLMNVGAWTQRNESDNPVITVFPIIAGNRGDVCTHVGEATPEGAVTAIQGSECIFKNGDSTAKYRKTTGTTATGWVTP